MTAYVSRAGDTVDLICYEFYGSCRGGRVEAVYEANRWLADYGAVLPAGVTINLPDIQLDESVDTGLVRLWD